jgi:hypothetical protein
MTIEEYKAQVHPGRRVHICIPSLRSGFSLRSNAPFSNISATACHLYGANGVEHGLKLDDGRILRVSERLVPFLVIPNAD